MHGEYVEMPCPYCDKGKIKCWWIPSSWSMTSKKTATFGTTKRLRKSSEIWLIQSGCSICGKSKEEVEKELKRKEMI